MKKIFLIFLIFCFIITVNADKYDWLSYSHSDIGYNQACSYYTLKNAGFIKLSDEKINSLNINSWDIKKGIINNPIIEWEHEIEYNVSHPAFKQIEIIEMCEKGWKEINNSYYCGLNHFHCHTIKTQYNINDTCIYNETIESGTYNEIRKKNIWSKISPAYQVSDIEIYPQEQQRFRICSGFQREYTNRGYTIEVDHIPEFDNEQYEKWVWWNSSYSHKYSINCSNMTDRIPIVINGSTGFKINNSNQIVWTYCSGTNMSLYFNNFTDFAVANYSTQIPTEIEYGNATDYLNTSVWLDSCWHFQKLRPIDSGGVFGCSSTYNSSNIVGKIYNANEYLAGSQFTKVGNIPTSSQWSISFWIHAQNTATWQRIALKQHSFMLYIDNTKLRIYQGDNTAWANYADWNIDVTSNSWNHIVINYASSLFAVYMNAIPYPTYHIGVPYNNNNNFEVGRNASGSINAKIDEFRYNLKCLNTNEIRGEYYSTEKYNGFGNLYGLENFTAPATTTTTTPPYDLEYFGDNILCLHSISGNEFCIEKNNRTLINITQDYYLTLKNIEHEKSIKGVFNFVSDHHQSVIRTIIIFIILSLIGTLGFYYLKK